MRSYLHHLSTPARNIAEVGGKAHNLMRLLALGCPVPPGFVLTTDAYRAFAASNGVPAELESEIEAAYSALGGGAVAVRSSATAEDLDNASSAGEQQTILNVRGCPALLDAIRSVWASLWTERAVVYRSRAGHNVADIAMGVIVQQMVDAQTAGVIFTAEPVSGNRECLVVEACRGLGDALVSGELTPDHYELDRATLKTRRQWLGDKFEPRDCLTGSQLKTLAKMALRIEAHFGCPQDIEWAVDRGGIHILQSRPITTLQNPAESPQWVSPVPGAIWVRRGGGGLTEYLPAPPSPLYATSQFQTINDLHDLHGEEMGIAASNPSYALINGHVYVRQDYKFGPRGFLLPVRYWQAARRGVRMWRTWLPDHLRKLDQLSSARISQLSNAGLMDHIAALMELNSVAWDMTVRASRTWVFTEPLFRHIYRWIKPIVGADPVVFLRGFESRTMEAEHALGELVRGALIDPEINRCLLLSGASQTLDRLSHTPGGRFWLEEFQSYCRKYGHLVENHDYLYAAPADDPAKVFASIRFRMNLIQSDPLERQKRLAAERAQATLNAWEKLASYPLRKAIFRWILGWAQEGASVREDVYFHALRGWPAARRAILALGARLMNAGAIVRDEDVFFLNWTELKQAAIDGKTHGWKTIVRERRSEHARRCQLSPPHSVPLEGPPLTVSRRIKNLLKRLAVGKVSRTSSPGELHGAPASPGRVTGPARLLHSSSEFGRLQKGDIIVTRNATPEWTPTFTIAAGLITDSGGPLSHTSILAREFGIPAVMGVQTATRSIAEGQLVTIDGGEGSIRLHQESVHEG
ncbi:MAG TPA: PEP/pyruvate-binding domain-containing protein [Bryobacteraceae bacterium]|nr:PEP/pyruvate-binding domain-containing protein [Bryobacteraceae bacterium]